MSVGDELIEFMGSWYEKLWFAIHGYAIVVTSYGLQALTYILLTRWPLLKWRSISLTSHYRDGYTPADLSEEVMLTLTNLQF